MESLRSKAYKENNEGPGDMDALSFIKVTCRFPSFVECVLGMLADSCKYDLLHYWFFFYFFIFRLASQEDVIQGPIPAGTSMLSGSDVLNLTNATLCDLE